MHSSNNKGEKMDYKDLFKKGLLIILAACCIGVGVGIILYGNVGSDTITVFQDGLHLLLNITYGQASRLYNAVLIAIAILTARKYFGAGTIVSALFVGYAIDFAYNGLVALNLNLSFFPSLLVFLVGQVIYTIGLSILIKCKLGMNALDSLLYKLIEVVKVDYKVARFVADILLTVVGYILGGVVGIGTVISIVTTGTMIDFFTKIGTKKEKIKRRK